MGDVQKEEPEYELDERGFIADLKDLKRSYRWSLRRLIQRRRELEEWITVTSGMTLEEMGEQKNRSAYKQWRVTNDSVWNELHDLKEMISDLNFAIEWLHTGKRPGNKRGIERRSAYQREVLLSPLEMQKFSKPSNSRSASSLTPDQRFQLEQALQMLSPMERKVYELAHGQNFTHEEVANMLAITKGSVSKMIFRAQKKVSGELQGNLFFWDSDED